VVLLLGELTAAIHGQQITEEYALEAIYMGFKILEEIKSVSE